MDTVLGLSMTPTTVGLVLVEGDGVDGATKNHDAFEVRRGGYSPVTTVRASSRPHPVISR